MCFQRKRILQKVRFRLNIPLGLSHHHFQAEHYWWILSTAMKRLNVTFGQEMPVMMTTDKKVPFETSWQHSTSRRNESEIFFRYWKKRDS